MSTLKIDLSDELTTFVYEQAAAYGYTSPAEYLGAVITRQRDLEQLRSRLLEGPQSGPAKAVNDSWFKALRAQAVK